MGLTWFACLLTSQQSAKVQILPIIITNTLEEVVGVTAKGNQFWIRHNLISHSMRLFTPIL
jgi:hypothetical protein